MPFLEVNKIMGVNLLFPEKKKFCSPIKNAGGARRATALSACHASFTG